MTLIMKIIVAIIINNENSIIIEILIIMIVTMMVMMMIIVIIIIMIMIIIIIMAFKGTIRDFFFLQSPHSTANSPTCMFKWPGCIRVQITCKTSSAYDVQVSCYVPLGTKGQLNYLV